MHLIILDSKVSGEFILTAELFAKLYEALKLMSQLIIFYVEKSHLMKDLKSDFHLPRKNCFICFNDSPSKMMKNAFYFILKALFVLKMFNFLSRILGMEKNDLIGKITLNLKFMTLQPG